MGALTDGNGGQAGIFPKPAGGGGGGGGGMLPEIHSLTAALASKANRKARRAAAGA